MKTTRDSWCTRLCCGFVLSVCLAAGGARALAQGSPEAPGPAVSSGLPTAPIGRMRLSFAIVPAPLGTIESNALGVDFSVDTAFAFGLRPAFDYSFNNYFFVGISPQFLLNVKGEDASDAAKELDLLVRIGGHAPVADNLHLYGYLAPGYSMVYVPRGDDNADGFVLGIAAGAIYSINDKLFAVGDIGYQLGYQSINFPGSDLDLHVRYLLIGLGMGIKL